LEFQLGHTCNATKNAIEIYNSKRLGNMTRARAREGERNNIWGFHRALPLIPHFILFLG